MTSVDGSTARRGLAVIVDEAARLTHPLSESSYT
jgi:hypothetical protein